jgi:O-acetyl-ADP-ribose deacetylase
MTPLSERIIIQQGDLTEMDVDAIVNAANNDLILGGGVAGAIRRKGGDEIQRECDEFGSSGTATTPKSLSTSTAHALRLAAERKLKTIAFPAVGTGVSGFPMDECARIMLAEVVKHLTAGSSLESVYFALFDSAACDVFQLIWQQLQKDLASGAVSA